jgi:hypothetical protein
MTATPLAVRASSLDAEAGFAFSCATHKGHTLDYRVLFAMSSRRDVF